MLQIFGNLREHLRSEKLKNSHRGHLGLLRGHHTYRRPCTSFGTQTSLAVITFISSAVSTCHRQPWISFSRRQRERFTTQHKPHMPRTMCIDACNQYSCLSAVGAQRIEYVRCSEPQPSALIGPASAGHTGSGAQRRLCGTAQTFRYRTGRWRRSSRSWHPLVFTSMPSARSPPS